MVSFAWYETRYSVVCTQLVGDGGKRAAKCDEVNSDYVSKKDDFD